jgi:large subunit ribosomal protein L10
MMLLIRKKLEIQKELLLLRNLFLAKAAEGYLRRRASFRLKGTNAVAFAFEDAPGVAKAIYEASVKNLRNVNLQDGFLKTKTT